MFHDCLSPYRGCRHHNHRLILIGDWISWMLTNNQRTHIRLGNRDVGRVAVTTTPPRPRTRTHTTCSEVMYDSISRAALLRGNCIHTRICNIRKLWRSTPTPGGMLGMRAEGARNGRLLVPAYRRLPLQRVRVGVGSPGHVSIAKPGHSTPTAPDPLPVPFLLASPHIFV